MSEYPESIQHYIQSIEYSEEVITPKILGQLLKESQVDPEALTPWIDLDHPAADGYGRQLIYEGDDFEIMLMSWRTGDFSAIHDHGSAQWGAVQYFGTFEHRCFRLKDGIMTEMMEETTQDRQINLVGSTMVHEMGNPTPHPFLSLHTYGTYGEKRPITKDSRIFEFYRDEIQYTDGGVFYLLPDEMIHKREAGLKADQKTLEKHYFQLLMRAQCMLRSDETSDEKKRH